MSVKGVFAEMNWLAVNRQSQSNSDSESADHLLESTPYWKVSV
jgi:hypothetical protein